MTNAKYKTPHPHKKLIEEYLNDTSTEFEYLSYACDGSPRKWGDCFATSIINDVGNHSSFRVKEKQLKVPAEITDTIHVISNRFGFVDIRLTKSPLGKISSEILPH